MGGPELRSGIEKGGSCVIMAPWKQNEPPCPRVGGGGKEHRHGRNPLSGPDSPSAIWGTSPRGWRILWRRRTSLPQKTPGDSEAPQPSGVEEAYGHLPPAQHRSQRSGGAGPPAGRESCALVTDAGMPAISDPGRRWWPCVPLPGSRWYPSRVPAPWSRRWQPPASPPAASPLRAFWP